MSNTKDTPMDYKTAGQVLELRIGFMPFPVDEVNSFRNQWASTTEAFESLIKKSSEI